MRAHLRRFIQDRSGNFAMMLGVATVPLLLGVGLAIDYSTLSAARSHLQEVADAASLSLAASRERDEEKLQQMAEDFVQANHSPDKVQQVQIVSLDASGEQIDLKLGGTVGTSFMALANIKTVDVQTSALAVRAVQGSLEVALVLDNTWSMSEKLPDGRTKIEALKEAAGLLTTQLFANKDAQVRVALVPYADYVNVGKKFRGAAWLSIPDDYTVQPAPKVCQTKTTKSVCVASAPTYACTKVVDGVPEAATCGGGCTKSEVQTVPPYESCTGGGSPTTYTWHGCVGSRIKNNNRLHDKDGSEKYPGLLDSSQKCLNPIVPLTASEGAVQDAIDAMKINIGGYKPNTYIPAGLVWGQNLLSETAPFTEGEAYDPANRKPRKVVVLMTDGENTIRFNSADGRHLGLSTNAATAKGQIRKTNDDTAAICAYMKSNNIEIYSVAFMVKSPAAKALLEGCATDAGHYYDASDAAKLVAAFTHIGESLSVVRLAR